ncbi:hypothetical protein AURDEDRAFT_188816, partial [Auricularia subglabra TFB-10046 SS5]
MAIRRHNGRLQSSTAFVFAMYPVAGSRVEALKGGPRAPGCSTQISWSSRAGGPKGPGHCAHSPCRAQAAVGTSMAPRQQARSSFPEPASRTTRPGSPSLRTHPNCNSRRGSWRSGACRAARAGPRAPGVLLSSHSSCAWARLARPRTVRCSRRTTRSVCTDSRRYRAGPALRALRSAAARAPAPVP